MDVKEWIKKRKWDIVFLLFLGLMMIPSVRTPVMVAFQRIFARTPTEMAVEKQKDVQNLNWYLHTLSGEQANLSSSNGKVIIINLWATWCPPCIAEMPSLQQLYNQYQGQVDFYFISNEKPEVVQKFMDEKGYDFPVFIATENPPKEMQSASLPTTYLIDKQRKIRMEEVGAHDWMKSSFLKQLESMLRD